MRTASIVLSCCFNPRHIPYYLLTLAICLHTGGSDGLPRSRNNLVTTFPRITASTRPEAQIYAQLLIDQDSVLGLFLTKHSVAHGAEMR